MRPNSSVTDLLALSPIHSVPLSWCVELKVSWRLLRAGGFGCQTALAGSLGDDRYWMGPGPANILAISSQAASMTSHSLLSSSPRGSLASLGFVSRRTVARGTPLPSAGPSVTRDRKSTRLNSSHGYLSYAVFCLKKK